MKAFRQFLGGCTNITYLNVNNFNLLSIKIYRPDFSSLSNVEIIDANNIVFSKDLTRMFQNLTNLKEINLSNADTSNVTNMSLMFTSCTSIANLDLSSFDTSNVTDIEGMFNNCPELVSIQVSSKWVSDKFNYSNSVFWNDVKLVGGLETEYNISNMGSDYAHIDGGSQNPGYFTEK